jgi:hypothetical protein
VTATGSTDFNLYNAAIVWSETVEHGLGTPHYNPYGLQSTRPWKEESDDHLAPHSVVTTQSKRSLYEGFADFYRSVSWVAGFKEKFSLILLIFFGGTLIGFCLARTIMMNPANVRDKTVQGEWFWYRQRLYKPCIFIHVYLSIISGIFAVFQFIPAIRRRAVILHRINGYLVLALLIPSTVSGAIVARRAFGGELNVQSSFYTLSFLIVFSALSGIMNVKQTRKHRKWMLRTVTFAAAPITAHFAMFAARRITSEIGSYFATWRCDEILFVLNNTDTVTQLYPQCAEADDLGSLHAAIRVAVKDGPLGFASSVRATFGMALWLAIVIHIIGVEFYIRKSENANQFRRGFVLERSDVDDGTERRIADDG